MSRPQRRLAATMANSATIKRSRRKRRVRCRGGAGAYSSGEMFGCGGAISLVSVFGSIANWTLGTGTEFLIARPWDSSPYLNGWLDFTVASVCGRGVEVDGLQRRFGGVGDLMRFVFFDEEEGAGGEF